MDFMMVANLNTVQSRVSEWLWLGFAAYQTPGMADSMAKQVMTTG
jgi:hypothetical protein